MTDREMLLEELEFLAAAPDDGEANSRWLDLLYMLDLKWGYYKELIDVVREGGWRDAADPRRFIRMRVVWSHFRWNRGPREEITGYSHPHPGMPNAAPPPKAATKIDRFPKGTLAACLPAEYVVRRPLSREEVAYLGELNRLGDGYPDDWDCEGPIDRGVIPNWDKIATDAGLDRHERRAVAYRADGISREDAIAEQRSKSMKLSLQSAYKRIQRGKWDKLKRFVHSLVAQEHDRKFPEVFTFTPGDADDSPDSAGPKIYTLREAATEFGRREPIVERWVNAGMLPTRGSGDDSKPLFTKEDLDRFKQERQPFVRAPIRPK